jgi:hypothetical protein
LCAKKGKDGDLGLPNRATLREGQAQFAKDGRWAGGYRDKIKNAFFGRPPALELALEVGDRTSQKGKTRKEMT